MQKRRSKNLRRNIDEIWKMWHGKSTKKVRSNEENYQGGSQQRRYTGGRTRDTTRNIGEEWKGIGGNGRARSQ